MMHNFWNVCSKFKDVIAKQIVNQRSCIFIFFVNVSLIRHKKFDFMGKSDQYVEILCNCNNLTIFKYTLKLVY